MPAFVRSARCRCARNLDTPLWSAPSNIVAAAELEVISR
jgi:hypothetical protein